MIKIKFSVMSLEEIDYAFKLERFGEYPERSEHFQLFNSEYVSSVLGKYRSWLMEKRRAHNIPFALVENTKDEISQEQKEAAKRKGIIDNYNFYLETGTIGEGRLWSYPILFEKNLLPYHGKEMKAKTLAIAVSRMKMEISRDNYSSKKRKEIKHIIKKAESGENKLKSECQKIILEGFYRKIKLDGTNFEKIVFETDN